MAYETDGDEFRASVRTYFLFPVSLVGAIITTISVGYYVANGDYDGLLRYFNISLPPELTVSFGTYSHQIVGWVLSWLSLLLQATWFQYIAAATIVLALSSLGAAVMFAAKFHSKILLVLVSILISLPTTTFASISAAQLSGEIFRNIDQYPSASGGRWYHSVGAVSSGWLWPELTVISDFELTGASQSISNREYFILFVLSGVAIGAAALYGPGGLVLALVISFFSFLTAQTYLEVRNYPRPPAVNSPPMPAFISARECMAPLTSQLIANEHSLIRIVRNDRKISPQKVSPWLFFFSSDTPGMNYIHCMQFSPGLETAFRELVLYKLSNAPSAQCEFAFIDGTMMKGILKLSKIVKLVSFTGDDCAAALSAPGRGAPYLDASTLSPYFTGPGGETIRLQ